MSIINKIYQKKMNRRKIIGNATKIINEEYMKKNQNL